MRMGASIHGLILQQIGSEIQRRPLWGALFWGPFAGWSPFLRAGDLRFSSCTVSVQDEEVPASPGDSVCEGLFGLALTIFSLASVHSSCWGMTSCGCLGCVLCLGF